MGGNALKAIGPSRLSSSGVLHLFNRVEWVANMLGYRVRLVPWVSDKVSHGDVDIIVTASSFAPEDMETLERMLGVPGASAYKHVNGPVTSIAVPLNVRHTVEPQGQGPFYAQVDLIFTPQPDFTSLYYSGGGLGMLIGRVAASNGYVFASDGLRLRANSSEPWSRDITLTTDPREALEFLGYDPALGGSGFETEEDVWRFALSGRVAKPWMFVSENTNAENKNRDSKRKNFIRFQEWLQKTYSPDELAIPVGFDRDSSDWYYDRVGIATGVFQRDFMKLVVDQRVKHEETLAMHTVWGRSTVCEVLGDKARDMTDSQIGEIIRVMQAYLPPKQQRVNIYQYNPEVAKQFAALAANLAIKHSKD